MNIPYHYIIHDIRTLKDFKGITICGYKRKDVLNAFQNSIINNKLEDALRWCVEMHSTGLNKQIWDSFKNIYIQYIHINSPKLFFYLLKREKDYNNIISSYPKKHELFTRNNQEIRNLFCELTALCTLTKKNNSFLHKSLPIINNKSFEKEDINQRMISKNLDKIIDFIFNNSTNEMKLALNEIINNISSNKGTFQNCIYWYLWIEKIEHNRKKENNVIFSNEKINKDPYFDHWTTILWNIILSFENKIDKNDLIFIKKMRNVYKKGFKLNYISKKKYYFFISFYILKNNINWNINMFVQEYLLIQSNANINKVYKNIIDVIEANLSNESKTILYKKYNKLYKNISDEKTSNIKRVINTNLDENINKVLFTHSPDYDNLKKNKNNIIILDKLKNTSLQSNSIDEKIFQPINGQVTVQISGQNNDDTNPSNLVSKNMTLRDVENKKENSKNKKLDAFTQFIAYKKKELPKITDDNTIVKNAIKHKCIIDYYKDDKEQLKNVNLGSKENSKIDEILNQISCDNNNVKEYKELDVNPVFKNINFSKKK